VMCIVMLKSAKDQVLGVDTPRQQVPQCVRFGMACLLIRDIVGSVPCSDKWELGVVTHPGFVTPRVSNPHDYVDHVFKRP
jgi:hypothetical protein